MRIGFPLYDAGVPWLTTEQMIDVDQFGRHTDLSFGNPDWLKLLTERLGNIACPI